MTKKHYEAAAAIVRSMVGSVDYERRQRVVAAYYAALFGTFKPDFDHKRFYALCGVDL